MGPHIFIIHIRTSEIKNAAIVLVMWGKPDVQTTCMAMFNISFHFIQATHSLKNIKKDTLPLSLEWKYC
jgi:hypothetical protein